jgi:hypothetical protein
LASRRALNHSNRITEHQEKQLPKSATKSRAENFSGFFWKFSNFEILAQIQKFLGRIRELWLNRKLGKVLKQQIHGLKPRKTQQIERSVEIPFGLIKKRI